MEDLSTSSLHESKNELCARLINILTPLVMEGIRSIFEESCKLCRENGELEKYMMTFQNLLSRVPKWNAFIIEKERIRMIEKSMCGYLEELITCVHVIQLKILSSIRVSAVSKKIDVKIPKLDDFIHKVYINCSRKIYSNVYLFEQGIEPLRVQKNNRELEIIVQECIMNTIRESMPIENLIRSYMEETVQVEEEVFIEDIEPEPICEEPLTPPAAAGTGGAAIATKEPVSLEPKSSISFSDKDNAMTSTGDIEIIDAPKSIQRLEQISEERATQRRLEQMEEEDDSLQRLKISDEPLSLDLGEVEYLDAKPEIQMSIDEILSLDAEELI